MLKDVGMACQKVCKQGRDNIIVDVNYKASPLRIISKHVITLTATTLQISIPNFCRSHHDRPAGAAAQKTTLFSVAISWQLNAATYR